MYLVTKKKQKNNALSLLLVLVVDTILLIQNEENVRFQHICGLQKRALPTHIILDTNSADDVALGCCFFTRMMRLN